MRGDICQFFVVFIQTASTACFCFYVFHDQLKTSIRRIAVYTVLLSCAFGVLSVISYLIYSKLPGLRNHELPLLIIILMIGFFCLRCTVFDNSSHILFILYLALHVQYLCLSTTYLIYLLYFPSLAAADDYSPADLPGFGLPILLLLPPFALISRRIYMRLRQADTAVYHRIWLIPLLFLMLYFIQVFFYSATGKDAQIEADLMRLIITICAFVTYSQMASAIAQSAKATKEEEIHTQLIHQLDLQRSRMEDIETHIEEIRRIRHDQRQHIQVLKGLLENNEVAKALVYLDDYETSAAASVQPTLCENFVVNALCCRYHKLAVQSGITVTLNLSLPQKVTIAGCDLAVIVGNLWENAIAATLDADSAHQFIRLWIQTTSNTVLIRMENGYGGVIHESDGQILSTKPGRNKKPGVGIASIKSVAARYEGIADFTYNSKKFTASVLLYTEHHV